jgi:GT2 family glycosyltransferase
VIGVAIVNYRTGALCARCLGSLAEATAAPLRVVVVDNASGDGSAAVIRDAVAAWRGAIAASLVEAPDNRGFAAGSNVAIRSLLADPAIRQILLLNPDTVPAPHSLDALAALLEREPRAGIAGGRCVSESGQTLHTAFRFPSLATELAEGLKVAVDGRGLGRVAITRPMRHHAHTADWVEASCMLVRREALETIGLLDESFFLYFEEPDLCRRAAAAGWRCWYVPECVVEHVKGASTPGDERSANEGSVLPQAWYDSRRTYFRKHHGAAYLLIADALRRLGMAAWRLRCRTLGTADPVAPEVYAAWRRNTFPGREARR